MNKSIIIGLFTGLGLIVYFVLMRLFGLEGEFWLRMFNFAILAIGVYVLHTAKFKRDNQGYRYLKGLRAGLVLCVTAVVVFVAFLGIYVSLIDPTFVNRLEESKIWGNDLTRFEAAFAILIEGIVSSAVISFIMMQYFKRNMEDSTNM